jgi:hypothetical protein
MKKIFSFSCVFVSLYSYTFSQKNTTDRTANLMQYGQYIQAVLQGNHEAHYKAEFDTLSKWQYSFLVSFNIDTAGKLINLKMDEETFIPNIIKAYTQRLFYSTSGHWYPEIKNCLTILSSTITCHVSIVKKFTSSEERMRQFAKDENELKLTRASIFNSNEPNHCSVILTY